MATTQTQRVSLEHAQTMIRTQDLNRAAIYTVDRGSLIGRYEPETADELCGNLEDMLGEVSGWVRVELFNASIENKPGKRSLKEEPLVLQLEGRLNRNQPQAAPAMAGAPVTMPDVERAEKLARLEAQLEYERKERERLETELQAMAGTDADEDEEEGEEYPDFPPPSPWTPEAITGIVKEVLPALRDLLRPTPPAAMAGSARVEPVNPEGITPEDLELLAAVRAWKEQDPDTANNYIGQLRAAFVKPRTDEAPKAA